MSDSKQPKKMMTPEGETEYHEYDGIIELNHPIPRWFNRLFWVTVAGSLLYGVFYALGPAEPLQLEWEADRQALAASVYQAQGGKPAIAELGETELAALVSQAPRRDAGAKAFAAKCASCHGAQGQGGIGPNLTDRHWLHGGRLADVARVIRDGVADKGMPPWGSLMNPEELQSVTAFIGSIRGSNPPNAKAPQGQPVAM